MLELHAEEVDVFHVAAAWLARCETLAKGCLLLVREELYAPAGVLYRALWELWIEWRFMLRIGDRRVNAAKVLLSAQIEALEVVEGHRDRLGADNLDKLRQDVADFEAVHREASRAVREQRERRHFSWSGLSYSAMEKALGQGPGVYGLTSWEAHGTVTTIRDVRVEARDRSARLEFGQTEDALAPEFILFSAGGVLFYVYNDFAEMWGLQPVRIQRAAE
ncbi:MAG: hypothetical protein KGM47_12940 [Acidobacteriota bacterium]|nr:hypothetical protein [Acidobacteriota bacterium]